MAVSFDSGGSLNLAAGNSLGTWTHTVSGDNPYLIVGIASGTALVGTVTYAGTALVGMGSKSSGARSQVSFYSMKAPPLGANDVVISVSGTAAPGPQGLSVSYNNTHQSKQPDAFVLGSAIGTSILGTLTSVHNNIYLVGMAAQGTNSVITGSASGQTDRIKFNNTRLSSIISDLTSIPVGGGKGTMSWTAPAGTFFSQIVAGITPFNALSQTFTENFSSGTMDLTKWTNNFGSISYTNGGMDLVVRLNNTGYSGIDSLDAYNMTSSYFNCQVTAVPSQADAGNETFFNAQYSGSQSTNAVFIYINSGQLSWWKKLNNVQTKMGSVVYDSNVHKYVQVRELAGTTYFDYSTDGAAYTALGSFTNIFAMTDMVLEISAGNFNATHSAGSFSVDNINIATNTTPTATLGYMDLIGVGI